MAEELNFEIPSRIEFCLLDRLPALIGLDKFEQFTDLDIRERTEINSLFTGIDYDILKRAPIKQNNELFFKILGILAQYKNRPCKPSIKIGDQIYDFIKDASNLPTGWYVDVSAVDFEASPELIPAFCYIERGMSYAQQDKNKNIVNKLSKRAEQFKEHLPLNLYLDMSTFFLMIYLEWKKSSTTVNQSNPTLKRMKTALNHSLGKLSSMTLPKSSEPTGMMS